MADIYSTGYNNDNATPPVKHAPSEGGGRVRIYRDTYTQGAADGTIGDVLHMKRLPGNARILPGGKLIAGTGNTGETLSVGVTGSAALFLAATAAETAAVTELAAHLPAAVGGYVTPAAGIEVIVTNATAAIKAAQVITLYIPYVID
jgi:hypothetical protein